MANEQPAWPAVRDEKPSYLTEMLTHQYTLYGFLMSLLVAVMAAFPYGFGVALIPVLFYAALVSIAAMFIPSHPVFKEAVDKKFRAMQREQTRQHLIEEISRRIPRGSHDPQAVHWMAYDRLRERLRSLEEIASKRKTSLSGRDLERLDDSTADFLGLWLSRLVNGERLAMIDEHAVRAQLDAIVRQLADPAGGGDRKRLQKAADDLEGVMRRREGLYGRHTAAEAAMLAMIDTFDEVYQSIMANPNSEDATRFLQDAVERLNIEQNLGDPLEGDFDNLLPHRRAAVAAAAQRRPA